MRREMVRAMRGRFFVWMLLLLVGAAAGLLMDWFCFKRLLLNPVWHGLALLLGLALLQLVRRGARNTGRYLAKHGHDRSERSFEPDRLVDSGYYACMRHPMHFALLLAPPAVALVIGSLSFLLFIAPVEMLLIVLLVLVIEEPQAQRKFGDAYKHYRRRVPFFSLRWSCLVKLFDRHTEM